MEAIDNPMGDLCRELCKVLRLDPNRLYRRLSVSLAVDEAPLIATEVIGRGRFEDAEGETAEYMLLGPRAWAALRKAMLHSGSEQPLPRMSLSREIDEFRKVLYETQGIEFEQYT